MIFNTQFIGLKYRYLKCFVNIFRNKILIIDRYILCILLSRYLKSSIFICSNVCLYFLSYTYIFWIKE